MENKTENRLIAAQTAGILVSAQLARLFAALYRFLRWACGEVSQPIVATSRNRIIASNGDASLVADTGNGRSWQVWVPWTFSFYEMTGTHEEIKAFLPLLLDAGLAQAACIPSARAKAKRVRKDAAAKALSNPGRKVKAA